MSGSNELEAALVRTENLLKLTALGVPWITDAPCFASDDFASDLRTITRSIRERDARASAALLEVLEVLKAVVADFDDYPLSVSLPSVLIERARAAIAKASGGQS